MISEVFGKPLIDASGRCWVNACFCANETPGAAYISKVQDFIFGFWLQIEIGPTEFFPLSSSSSQAGVYPLPDSDALLLGDARQDRDDGILEKSAGVEIGLRERAKAHAASGELIQVLESGKSSLTGKAVERPENHHVKFPVAGASHKVEEGFTRRIGAGIFVTVQMVRLPTLLEDEGAELLELVFSVLVLSRDADINRSFQFLRSGLFVYCMCSQRIRAASALSPHSSTTNLKARQANSNCAIWLFPANTLSNSSRNDLFSI